MDWTALWVTLKVASFTSLILFLFGVPLAHWLANSKWRGKALVEALLTLPLILPPTVLGFYLLLVFGPRGPLGKAVTALTGDQLPFTFTGILIGSVIYNIPFAVRPFSAAFSAIDQRLVEASWCLGASRWRTFWRIVVPLAWPGIMTGVLLSFAHSIGEFGVVLMLGGNIPGETRTLSISIFDSVQALDYATAQRTSLALVGISFVILVVIHVFGRRGVPV